MLPETNSGTTNIRETQAQNKDPNTRFIAIALISASLLWAMVFVSYFYAGIVTGTLATVWFFVTLKRKQDELEENFRKLFSGKKVKRLDKHAVFKAQQSHRYSQSQGMGYLVLTADELYFEMGLLSKVLSIPVASITKVGQAKRMLGVGTIRPMLKVEFKDARGEMDAIVLFVKELAEWKREIAQAMADCH